MGRAYLLASYGDFARQTLGLLADTKEHLHAHIVIQIALQVRMLDETLLTALGIEAIDDVFPPPRRIEFCG